MSRLSWSPCPPCSKLAPARTASSWAVLNCKNIHVKTGLCTNRKSEEVLEIVVTMLERKKRKAMSLFKKTKQQLEFDIFPAASWQVTCVDAQVLNTAWQHSCFSLNPVYKQTESCLPLFLLSYPTCPIPRKPQGIKVTSDAGTDSLKCSSTLYTFGELIRGQLAFSFLQQLQTPDGLFPSTADLVSVKNKQLLSQLWL